MTFKDLLKAKDDAVAHVELTAEAAEKARSEHLAAEAAYDESCVARTAALKAIHDHLEEFGAHYDVDLNGTLTVYTASDDEPGFRAHHPVPGHADFAPKASSNVEVTA